MQPYVESDPFLLILDSWGGQKNSDLFQKFKDQNGQSSCTLKVIPPGCTPFAQPLDVYFHRQAKLFIKEIYNCTYLIKKQEQLSSKKDIIKIQSLVHNQLSAPIFTDMIQYTWYA